MEQSVVFMIDGWFMRKKIYELKTFYYNGKNIRKYCLELLRASDYLYRIFYYDTTPLEKKGHNPVTGRAVDFSRSSVAIQQKELLDSIKKTPSFALRLGETVWKGDWALQNETLKELLKQNISIGDLQEGDVRPVIQQKAVDMKMGMDIALIALKKIADCLIVITGDADIVPALKLARREGMQVGLDPLRNPVRDELSEYVDFIKTNIPK